MISEQNKLKLLTNRMQEIGPVDDKALRHYLNGVITELTDPSFSPKRMMALFTSAFDTGRLYQHIGPEEFKALVIREDVAP